MSDIEKLRELLAKATPGPWENYDGHIGIYIEGRPEWSAIANVNRHPNRGANVGEGDANAALIVAAVNALPELLKAARRVKEIESVAVDVAASLAAAISLLERGGKKAAPSDRMFEQMLTDYRNSLERARTALKETDNV